MKILITGFSPFGGEKIDPSYEAVKRLPDTAAGARLVKLEIPTAFARALELAVETIAAGAPESGGRHG